MYGFSPVEAYKNFKMGTEIDVAGIFIYDGMKELERIVSFAYESEAFSLSQGLRRPGADCVGCV